MKLDELINELVAVRDERGNGDDEVLIEQSDYNRYWIEVAIAICGRKFLNTYIDLGMPLY